MPKMDNGRVIPETGEVIFTTSPDILEEEKVIDDNDGGGSKIDMNRITDVYGRNLGDGIAIYAGTDSDNTTRILKFKTISTDGNISIADFGNNIKISLSEDIIKGIVDVSKGGTGRSFLNYNQLLVGNGENPVDFAPPPENNKVLSFVNGQYTWSDLMNPNSFTLIHTNKDDAKQIEPGKFSFYTNKNNLEINDFIAYNILYNNGTIQEYAGVLNENFQKKLRSIDGAKYIGYTPPLLNSPSTKNTTVDSVLIRNATMFEKLEHASMTGVTTVGNNLYKVDESDTNWDVQKFHSGRIEHKGKIYRLPDLLDSITSSNIRVPRILKTVQDRDDGLNRITIFDVSVNKEETYYVSLRGTNRAALGRFDLESDGFYSLTKIVNVPTGFYYDNIGIYDFGANKSIAIGEKKNFNGIVESFVRINSDGSYVDIPKNSPADTMATRPVMLESSESTPDCGFFVDNGNSLDFCVFSRNIMTPTKPKIINKNLIFLAKKKQLSVWGDKAIIAGVRKDSPSKLIYSYRYCFDFATLSNTDPYTPVWSNEASIEFDFDPNMDISAVDCSAYTKIDDTFVLFGIAKGPVNSKLFAWVSVGFDVVMKDLGVIAHASNDDIREISVVRTQEGYKVTYTIEDMSSTSNPKETYIAQVFVDNDRLVSSGSANYGIFKDSIRRSSSMSIEGNINHGSVADVHGIYNEFNGVCVRLELKYLSPISKILIPMVAKTDNGNDSIVGRFAISKVGDTSIVHESDSFIILPNGKSSIISGLFTSQQDATLMLEPGSYYIKLLFDDSINTVYPLYTELHGEYHGTLDRGVFRTFGTAKYDPNDPSIQAYDYNNTVHPGIELEFNYFI